MGNLTVAGLWHDTITTAHGRFLDFLLVAAVTDFLPGVILQAAFPQVTAGIGGADVPPTFIVAFVASVAVQALGAFAISDAAIRKDGGRLSLVSHIRLKILGKSVLAGLVLASCALLAAFALMVLGGLVAFVAVTISSAGSPSLGAGSALRWLLFAVGVPTIGWLTARLSPLTGVFLSEPVGVTDGIERAFDLSRGVVLPLLVPMLIFWAGNGLVAGLLRSTKFGSGPSIALGIGLLALGAVATLYASVFAGVVYRQLFAAERAAQSNGTLGATSGG